MKKILKVKNRIKLYTIFIVSLNLIWMLFNIKIEKKDFIVRNKIFLENLYSDFSTVKISESPVSYTVNTWDQLYNIITSDMYTYDSNTNILTRKTLNITINSNDTLSVNKKIPILEWQNVVIIPSEGKTVKLLRDSSYKEAFFDVEGSLSIGSNNSTGNIKLDGNRSSVTSISSLINAKSGTLNLYNNVALINNKKSSGDGTAGYGGALYVDKADIYISGSQFENNEARYGGAIFIDNETSTSKFNDVCIKNNIASEGSGGGIYARGFLEMTGQNTIISGNKAYTYGGRNYDKE